MTIKLKRHKGLIKIVIIMVFILFGWLYRELHPTIIFHTPQENKYLGKVSEISGSIVKLYINNHIVKYRLPYIWEWQEDDEVAFFINNYGNVIHKEDLVFWKQEVYLDENNCYLSYSTTEYCYGLRHILQSKMDKSVSITSTSIATNGD